MEQRQALALQFRKKYGSDVNGDPNVNPFFIGVFDTVAALGSYVTSALLVGAAVIILAVLSFLLSLLLFSFWPLFLWSLATSVVIAAIWYAVTHVQYAVGLPGYNFFQTLHVTAPKMQFYDKHLDKAVWYARHAMSIDENRADFARVEWGSVRNTGPARPDSYPDWLDQIWFRACIPTSAEAMPKTSARLSDIALQWMVHAAEIFPTARHRMAMGSRQTSGFYT